MASNSSSCRARGPVPVLSHHWIQLLLLALVVARPAMAKLCMTAVVRNEQQHVRGWVEYHRSKPVGAEFFLLWDGEKKKASTQIIYYEWISVCQVKVLYSLSLQWPRARFCLLSDHRSGRPYAYFFATFSLPSFPSHDPIRFGIFKVCKFTKYLTLLLRRVSGRPKRRAPEHPGCVDPRDGPQGASGPAEEGLPGGTGPAGGAGVHVGGVHGEGLGWEEIQGRPAYLICSAACVGEITRARSHTEHIMSPKVHTAIKLFTNNKFPILLNPRTLTSTSSTLPALRWAPAPLPSSSPSQRRRWPS